MIWLRFNITCVRFAWRRHIKPRMVTHTERKHTNHVGKLSSRRQVCKPSSPKFLLFIQANHQIPRLIQEGEETNSQINRMHERLIHIECWHKKARAQFHTNGRTPPLGCNTIPPPACSRPAPAPSDACGSKPIALL